MATHLARTETTDFFEQLWNGKPDDLWILVWQRAGKKSKWFQDWRDAAEFAAGEEDVYVGVGLSPSDKGQFKRCEANEIAGLAGLWADIDYEDGAAHKSNERNVRCHPTRKRREK